MFTSCATARDCAWNGRCVASSCVCDSAWSGPRCETLRLAPARKHGGYRSPHDGGHTSSWGGSILHYNGTWHIFAAEMANDCGIDYWEPNSRVVHATAPAAVLLVAALAAALAASCPGTGASPSWP